MKIIEPSVEFVDKVDGDAILRKIEFCGRTCYKSEGDGTIEGAKKFVRGLIQRGHESVLEHVNITVKIVCDRGVSHELVRHRLASYSQESTRYCNYGKDILLGEGLTFVKPTKDQTAWCKKIWTSSCEYAEKSYLELLVNDTKPEDARAVLPNSLKTEVVMTANLREWRHILKLRTSKRAHPDMRRIMLMLLDKFKAAVPVVFDDIEHAEEYDAFQEGCYNAITAPTPCHTDKVFTIKEWFAKLDEELTELKEIATWILFLDDETDEPQDEKQLPRIAEEAADLITVTTSFQEALGIDKEMRDNAQKQVNAKNKARGYC